MNPEQNGRDLTRVSLENEFRRSNQQIEFAGFGSNQSTASAPAFARPEASGGKSESVAAGEDWACDQPQK